MLIQLPAHVHTALLAYRTCEFTTLARDGGAVTVPVIPVILPERNCVLVTTSIAFPNKAFNVRRDHRVALLFSDPTASGLAQPPAVLIQGDAVVGEQIESYTPELAQLWRIAAERQPINKRYSANRFTRWLMDWYYLRLLIWVTPQRIRWWEQGDWTATSRELEESYVV